MGLNFFFITAAIVLLPLLLAIFLGRGFAWLDGAVATAQASLEDETTGYNPQLTAGHRIKVEADIATQLKEARRLAASRAASLPRGANMRIAPQTNGGLRTAQDGILDDPLTAVKIAAYHGWQGALQGAPSGVQAAAAPLARTGAGPAVKRELVPGQDYPVIEIADGMSPAEIRQARIANAKAKSAAVKAQKASGAPAAVAGDAALPPAATPAAPAAVAPSAAAIGIPEPDLIEITDDMDPAAKRQARISNSKAKSAYNKALKAAGVDPAGGPAPAPVTQVAAPVAEGAPTPPVAAAPAGGAAAAGIPEPDLIEITDDMDPAEKRQARISNSKAKSAYNKALKAAGIDPKSVA